MKFPLAFLIVGMICLGTEVVGGEVTVEEAAASRACTHSSDEQAEPTGDAGQFCSAFRGLCDSAKFAWLAEGFACDWSCTSWWGYPGRKATSCHWDCQTPLPPETWGTYGAGPILAFLNIGECDALAGGQVLEGFAMDFIRGVAKLELFWNGEPIWPLSLQMGRPSADACSWPMGLDHSHCIRESGFLAEIDTTQLPNGPGTLGLVASDFDGWTSKHELNVVIANRVNRRE